MAGDPSQTTTTPAILSTIVPARVLRHDPHYALSTLFFADGELRVPMVDVPVDAGVSVTIEARDVSIALSRPMDVSITNRLPGKIDEILPLEPPYVRVSLDLGSTRLHALVTLESVERLALETGLSAWAMIKSVAIGPGAVRASELPRPRRWPASDTLDR
ncbi:TOBE domain-containing protein [Bradyrhizobium sp. STM 3557]|uniref:TOBE domain-containing protein n=1 Tax=Bradyrhizobium sp. STM 3557 TaxID=578920 RepID=UPI00388E86E9